MNHSKKLSITLIIALFLSMIVFSGCSDTKTTKQTPEPKPSETQEITFLDQNDHEVNLKGPVNRIVVLQHHSLDILAMLGAQDKIVGVVKNWNGLLGSYMKDVFPGIEKLPMPGSLEDCNVEEVANLKPDLVIVAAQFKPDYIKQLETLGIPVMTVTLRGEGKQKEAQNPELKNPDVAYTRGAEWAVKKLGEITGKTDKANKLWDFAMADRKYVEENLKDVASDKKVRVFIANEKNMTYGSDKYVGCQLERAGAINVAAEEIKGYKEVNFEKVVQWNPDVIIVQDRYKDVYDNILKDDKWKILKAVENKNVILAPYWTKPWGNPAPDSIALGELWLASQFYPDKINKAEVEKKAKEFYKEFYGIEFKGTI